MLKFSVFRMRNIKHIYNSSYILNLTLNYSVQCAKVKNIYLYIYYFLLDYTTVKVLISTWAAD